MEAVVGIVGGALLGAVVDELLKEVRQAKDAISSFQPMFQRLESTLKSIIPRVDDIISLNHKLDIQQHKVEELNVIIRDGKSLLLKCTQISSISYTKKVQYGKELLDLDDRLKDYFLTLLPLDHFRNDLEMLNLVRDLHAKLVVESVADDTEFFSTTAYRRKGRKNLFLIKAYPHDLDLVDLSNRDPEVLSKGKYTITYRYNTKFGNVVVKSLTHDVKMTNNEFQQRMEEIGKIGKHPNIALPFGYYFTELDKYLLYDYVPPSRSLSSVLKEPTLVGTHSDWNNRLSIMLGAAKGITHIHSESGLVHGNIKSSNVVLNVGLNGCISDFCLAPMMNSPEPIAAVPTKKQRKSVPQLPAPELHTTKQATQQSDVYDFGVMLLEIVSSYGKHLFWHPNVLVEEAKILKIVKRCTEKDCRSRPKMDDVVKMIQKVISKEDIA